jgi:hypothetical protein
MISVLAVCRLYLYCWAGVSCEAALGLLQQHAWGRLCWGFRLKCSG